MNHRLLVKRGLEVLDASKFSMVGCTTQSLPSQRLQCNSLCGFWASQGGVEPGQSSTFHRSEMTSAVVLWFEGETVDRQACQLLLTLPWDLRPSGVDLPVTQILTRCSCPSVREMKGAREGHVSWVGGCVCEIYWWVVLRHSGGRLEKRKLLNINIEVNSLKSTFTVSSQF